MIYLSRIFILLEGEVGYRKMSKLFKVCFLNFAFLYYNCRIQKIFLIIDEVKDQLNSKKEIKMTHLINFFKDEEGATAVEYGIMVAAIAAVIVTIVFAIGEKVETAFNEVNVALDTEIGTGTGD